MSEEKNKKDELVGNPELLHKLANYDDAFDIDFEQFRELEGVPVGGTSYANFKRSHTAQEMGVSPEDMGELAESDSTAYSVYSDAVDNHDSPALVKLQEVDDSLVTDDTFMDEEDPVVIANAHLKSREQIQRESRVVQESRDARSKRGDIEEIVVAFDRNNRKALTGGWNTDPEFIERVAEIISVENNFDFDDVVSVIRTTTFS